MSTNKKANRLTHEKSPYLLQHAHNPVDWYPWGDEAFQKAKSEDKPIFLSIGYSTCHWCHVMERESFEDEDVARVLNKDYISIKVDREERPDIDSIYMTVCQTLTGSGGWPLTIIMTPDKKPFFAGTYFPKQSKYGRPGLIDLLTEIKNSWDTRKDELIKSGNSIAEAVKKSQANQESELVDRDTVDDAFDELEHFFDSIYGGFGDAPKFPTPHNLSFLLRYGKAHGEDRALKIVEKTLESMYRGGIFDHIGYGFSRYSTDRKWLVPHFEKMLYDNALLAIAYTEAYQVTGRDLYREVAQNIFTYVLRDMTSPEGGFYSAEDADSEGEEGKFFVWTPEEVESVIGKDDGETYCRYYNITSEGNFERKSIPNLICSGFRELEGSEELKRKLESMRSRLFEYREKRVHPYKDDKILTSWNGLMIAALAVAGRAFGRKEYKDAARRAAEFILDKLVREDGRVLARYRDGESAYAAYLDDYAFLVWGLIELYEAVFDPQYLKMAMDLNNEMLKLFWDDKDGGLFIYGNDSEELIARPKDIYDGAMPSGNSVAALNMLRLSRLAGIEELSEKAHGQFETFGGNVKDSPGSHAYFLMALLFSIMPAKEIVIKGERDNENTKVMLKEIARRFLPFSTVVLNDGDSRILDIVPYIRGQKRIDDKTTAYVCEDFACNKPVTEVNELLMMLGKRK